MTPVALALSCCCIVVLVSFCTAPVETSSTKLRIRFPQRIDVVHRHHSLRQYARRFPYGPVPPPPAALAAHKRRRVAPARKASRPRRRRPAPYGLDYAGAYRSWARAPGRRKRPRPPPLSLHSYLPDGRETYEDQELRQDPYHYQYQHHKQPSSHWEKYPPYYEEYGDQQDEYPEGAYSEYDGQKARRYRKRPRRPPPRGAGDDDGDGPSHSSSSYSSHGHDQGLGYPGRRRRPHYPPFADEYSSASGDDGMSAAGSALSPATASPAQQVSWSQPQQAGSHHRGHQDAGALEEHWSRQHPNHRPAGDADRWSQQSSSQRASGGWQGVGAEDRHWAPAAGADADIGYGEGLEDADGTVF